MKKLGAYVVTASFLVALQGFSVNAELGVGPEGKFKDATEAASSALHQALASMQLFLGAIDVHNVKEANGLKEQIAQELSQAATAYKDASAYAGGRRLNPVAGTQQDASDIDYFYSHEAEFGIGDNMSEVSVTAGVVTTLQKFADRVSATDVNRLSTNIVQQQSFFRYMLQMQYFLNSVTTVFRTG